MIRIDALWLAAEPIDMRAGAERLLARVVQVFGVAQAHHGYLFANARGTRIKLAQCSQGRAARCCIHQ
ncbi:IS66 family insertion sequence element accessory protein TnpB [Pseudacidovorax intermedius]|uniref:IS66 family insertion sequence element accessory protein TnpB n=1 Tax=Pseudacidovorax intermedius TaxID=433924 RepID=UPI0009DC0F46|nr:IS66 family insertion sequence element accessory protein TnpB [Pseudacidovorax intermedius]